MTVCLFFVVFFYVHGDIACVSAADSEKVVTCGQKRMPPICCEKMNEFMNEPLEDLDPTYGFKSESK